MTEKELNSYSEKLKKSKKDYIKVKGYKSIKSTRINFAPINILIGANGSGKSNFISFFYFLNRVYNRKLNDYIALNGGDNKFLHNGKKQTDTISFRIEFNNGRNGYSDGTLRFIALTILFLQPVLPDTIISDEPELRLHPAAIAKLAGMIKSVSAKKCQVIIATQSTDLFSHFLPEDIITVNQIDGTSFFERLNNESLKQWLDDYTIDDL